MNVEIEIVKGIPVEQIEQFEDRVVYNTAVLTREETKSLNAFPQLSGTLMREELAQQIIGSNKEYGLGSGTSYAKRVYNYENVNWTNKATIPHWYFGVFNKNGDMILSNAIGRSLKGLK